MKFYMPTQVYCERDCIMKHAGDLAGLGTRALIVTGRHSSKINGSLDDLTRALNQENVSWFIFDDIEENPSIETVMRATALGLEKKVDFVIGLGGGSPMDASKAIAMMIANPDRGEEVFYQKIELTHLPVAAVPTTAGTGSEVTPWAILTIHSKRTKQSISHRIFPSLALMDSRYLKKMGRHTLISTSVDTMAHLIESFLVVKADAFSSIFSEKGLQLWAGFKQHLLEDQMTDEDYDRMMQACMLGGIAIAHTGTGLPHALSYKLTYELGFSHGIACGYTLGRFVDYYADEKMRKKTLDCLGFTTAEDFCRYLEQLIGKPEVSSELWEADVRDIYNNPGKMGTYPYDISEDVMMKYLY